MKVLAEPEAAASPAIEAEVERVKVLLKRTIAGSGSSQREVERRLGWGEGYVSQILRGKVVFKFKHCFAILAVIGVAPEAFFAALVAESRPRRPSRALREEVGRLVRELLDESGPVVGRIKEPSRQGA